jgi:hypothetical protein
MVSSLPYHFLPFLLSFLHISSCISLCRFISLIHNSHNYASLFLPEFSCSLLFQIFQMLRPSFCANTMSYIFNFFTENVHHSKLPLTCRHHFPCNTAFITMFKPNNTVCCLHCTRSSLHSVGQYIGHSIFSQSVRILLCSLFSLDRFSLESPSLYFLPVLPDFKISVLPSEAP